MAELAHANDRCAHCGKVLSQYKRALSLVKYDPHVAPFSTTVEWFCGPRHLVAYCRGAGGDLLGTGEW